MLAEDLQLEFPRVVLRVSSTCQDREDVVGLVVDTFKTAWRITKLSDSRELLWVASLRRQCDALARRRGRGPKQVSSGHRSSPRRMCRTSSYGAGCCVQRISTLGFLARGDMEENLIGLSNSDRPSELMASQCWLLMQVGFNLRQFVKPVQLHLNCK